MSIVYFGHCWRCGAPTLAEELDRHSGWCSRCQFPLRSYSVPINEKTPERMLKWFEFDHLPAHLQVISKPFGELALLMCALTDPGPERTAALRHLLESKDAMVRAKLHPGG